MSAFIVSSDATAFRMFADGHTYICVKLYSTGSGSVIGLEVE